MAAKHIRRDLGHNVPEDDPNIQTAADRREEREANTPKWAHNQPTPKTRGPKMISPNDLLASAKSMMLDGREPANVKDWSLVMNFVAANVAKGMEEPICRLFRNIYSVPLPEADVVEIAKFQAERRP